MTREKLLKSLDFLHKEWGTCGYFVVSFFRFGPD